MTDSKKLRAKIKNSGLKYQLIAKELEISSYDLSRKIDNCKVQHLELAKLIKSANCLV